MQAWVNFLRAHAAVTRELNAELVTRHGLTINDYEVLLHLNEAPGRRLRGVDLSDRLSLTASGITRLLDGLERRGYVDRERCASDGRVTYAVLTEAGVNGLRTASRTHLRGVRRLFESHFDEDEAATLASLLERLPQACSM
jgi:DNA-binding MarR family transcriptional regulator